MSKAIVNGRKYDTETAQFIVTSREVVHPDNLSRLYRKQNGEYFIQIEGFGCFPSGLEGIMNKCKQHFIPLQTIEAKAFVEEYCDADTYVRLFGDVDE